MACCFIEEGRGWSRVRRPGSMRGGGCNEVCAVDGRDETGDDGC